MKLNNFKRLIVEEFPQETQPTVEKLSFALNPFLEQVVNAFNKNIDFDNLNQEVIEFTVTVDANGRPTTQTELRSSLRTKVRGYIVIRAKILTDPFLYLPLLLASLRTSPACVLQG
jgi:hypothetical protein